MIIAIDPAATSGRDTAARLALLVGKISSDPDVRLPGRRGQNARRQALTEGIDIDDDLMAEIERL